MRRRLITLVALLAALVATTVYASYYDFEQITVDATAGGKTFSAAKITPTGTTNMTSAICRLRTAEISYLYVDPVKLAVTASVGTLLEPGDQLIVTNREDMLNFRAIRTGATSGQLDCIYKGTP